MFYNFDVVVAQTQYWKGHKNGRDGIQENYWLFSENYAFGQNNFLKIKLFTNAKMSIGLELHLHTPGRVEKPKFGPSCSY